MPTADTKRKPLIVVSSRNVEFSLTHRHILMTAGYATDLSSDLEDTMLIVGGRAVDAVLLDASDASAASFCEGLKRQPPMSETPVVALLRAKAVRELPMLLHAGADEVFICPVSPQQYLDSLDQYLLADTTKVRRHHRLSSGKLSVDLTSHRAYWGEEPFHLGLIEFRLLSNFISEVGRVFTRREIIEKAWPAFVFVDPRTVTVHVARLRKILLGITGFDWIRTVRGVGYGLVSQDPNPNRSLQSH